jgi:phosphoribosylamine--glycine ligase
VRTCVVGAGGREHALALALSVLGPVVVAPGNPGMAGHWRRQASPTDVAVVDADPTTLDADFFVIGPEAPLAAGLADQLRAGGRVVLGPGAAGARLEASKVWMKEVLDAAGVPTARWRAVETLDEAQRALDELGGPWAIKTDGLAAGKGVLVTSDRDQAVADAEAKLSGRAFGDAGRRLVIEEALSGPELSVLVVTDGERAVALPPARDAKRLLDGDAGPNTGGMGAFSPVPDADDDLVAQVVEGSALPVLDELRRRGVDYRGVLFVGLMLTSAGPVVLELNVRLGDPEAQAVLARSGPEAAEALLQAARGRLEVESVPARGSALCVVAAAPGYPVAPRLGEPISGIEGPDGAEGVPGVQVLHAGTACDAEGRLVAVGGRVLDVVATHDDGIAAARDAAYRALGRLVFPGGQWRGDIGCSAGDSSLQGAAR